MRTRLIFAVKKLFKDARPQTKDRLAFQRATHGRLEIREAILRGINADRHALVARLLDPTTGCELDGWPAIHDVHIIRLTPDELIIKGTERQEDIGTVRDLAQAWMAQPIALEELGED